MLKEGHVNPTVTLRIYDASDILIGTCTTTPTGIAANWRTNFLGFNSPVDNIKRIEISGAYVILDLLTFESACVPFTMDPVANQTVCNNANTTAVNFSGAPAGAEYNWTNDQTSIGLAASGTGNIASFVATNTGTVPVVSTITVTPVTVSNIYYIRNVNPWGLTLNDDAMNAVFGASNWTAANYGVNPATVFSGGTRFVFIEGSDNNANAMNAFITANITTIENWVSAGGRLFMNAAPNEGGSMNWGFGGVNCVYPAYSSNVTAAVPAHPVYLGPFTPVATAFSGTSYTHANLTGGGLTNLMNGDSPGSVMGSLNWGSGFVMFATRTTTNFHTPSAESQNLLQNIISYTADMSGATNCTGTPINFTITVNPTPTVNAVADQVVCNGAPTTAVNFSGNTTGTICATANEGNNLTLTAPAGMVFTSILFASYGTPNGVCGSFSIGGCHAANSMAIVSGLAIGQNSVTIPADNALFGDPCFGTGKRLYVEAVYSTAGTTAYNWTNNTTSIGLAAAGSGNIASFTATNITNAPVVATVTVTPTYTNSGVSCDGTAITFTITVNPTPTVNAQADQTVCVGTTTTATFTGAVSGTVYNWTNTNTNIGLGANGIGDISFTSTNATVVPITGTITVTPTYTNGGTTCTGTPVSFTITVNPTPTVNAQANQTVCVGTTTTATFTGSVSGTVYNWTNTNTNIGLGANGTGDISFTSTNATAVPITGTITVTPAYTNGGTTCTGTPVSFTITVNPTPTVNAQPNQTVCVGTITTATFTGAVAGTIYNWTNTNTNIGLGASGTGDISFTSTNATLVPITGTLTVTPAYTNGGTTCTGTPVSFTITVNPTPTVNAVPNQSICPGALTAPVTFTGAIAGTVFNWTNNNTSIGLGASGTGNIAAFTGVNPGTLPNVGTITVTPTYTTGGVSCSGTPITFTITVTPNPSLVIVADPGTTICEGDPTLLTVRIGTSSPISTLYNQTGAQVNGSPSQVFEPANAGFNSQSADDFTVPAGATWTITQVTANGIGTGNPTSVNVFFYANSASNLPGAAVASYTNIVTFVRTGSNYNVTLPAALNLAGGTYWVSIQVNMSFATGGQWFWANFGTTNIGNQYAWQNPGGGFGTPCPAWGYGSTGCNVGGGVARNNIFSIIGSSLVDGGPLPGGYTFLWSPAAGLSSTTSNPVAASPMNTTTYTVVATTGAGCTRTASILITVNKRPTVTAQPLSSVNCEGTAATFTVAGTGTALTYQWQVSTTGIGGPWVNLANTAPYSNVTTATLTVNPVTLAMNGYAYRCVLSGSCAPILTNNISNPAVLTVNPNPAITVTPASGCGGVAGINGLLLTASGANSYTWSPLAGLYTNAIATIPYTGGNTATVYAAPTAFTAYTVTGTLSTTGCFSTATAFINYTPPAPTVVPSSVTMCLGDPAVKLKSSSATSSVMAFNSGVISVPIPDNSQAGASHNLTVSGIPANATVTGMKVKMTIPHTFIGDLVVALKAPNNNVLNLDFFLSNSFGGVTTGFLNTVITSAAGAPALSTGSNPYTASFRPDGQIAATGNGPAAPTGYTANMANFNALISTLTPANVNGVYTLAMYDGGAIDIGTLTNWEIEFTYVQGVPATPAVWSPAAGLFSDALATVPYVAGTAVDSVWTRPTPAGVYPYQVTVQSLPTPPATPATTYPAGNGNSTITFNVRNNNAYPVTLSTIDSRTFAAGATNVSAYFKPSAINGAPGAISAANGWNQFGSASITGTGTGVQPFMTGLTLVIPAGATYGICVEALTPTAGA
ncbi:MAG: hypothetical protein IPI54_06530 [Chitinophagaceae bacterium]|nr:hypothetical protein [Chitinophagaceae bacterium]